MRFALTAAASLLAVAACQKADTPIPAPSPLSAAELGQDDPSVKFTPPPPGEAHKFTALSKTAMSITGDLNAMPSAQVGPNSPPGMTFAFSKGMTITSTLMPGAAMDGPKPYDWKAAFPGTRPLELEKIEMYSVETELPAPPAKTGSICDRTMFVATYLDDAGTPSSADDVLMLAAFTSDDWPPSKPDTALCAIYSYSPSRK